MAEHLSCYSPIDYLLMQCQQRGGPIILDIVLSLAGDTVGYEMLLIWRWSILHSRKCGQIRFVALATDAIIATTRNSDMARLPCLAIRIVIVQKGGSCVRIFSSFPIGHAFGACVRKEHTMQRGCPFDLHAHVIALLTHLIGASSTFALIQ